jgi:hypothetical protein
VKKFIVGVSVALISAAGLMLAGSPASAETCTLFKQGKITTGWCGKKPYYAQEYGNSTLGWVGKEPLSMYNNGNGNSFGMLGKRPLNCFKFGTNMQNCY